MEVVEAGQALAARLSATGTATPTRRGATSLDAAARQLHPEHSSQASAAAGGNRQRPTRSGGRQVAGGETSGAGRRKVVRRVGPCQRRGSVRWDGRSESRLQAPG